MLCMELMDLNKKTDRQRLIQFAIGMAAIDGGKPTAFTHNLLSRYENGEISAHYLQKAILEKYAKVSHT